MTNIACFAIVFLLLSHVVAKQLEEEDLKVGPERLAALKKIFGKTDGNGDFIEERGGCRCFTDCIRCIKTDIGIDFLITESPRQNLSNPGL
ncbi:hypothetical protein Ddc_16288 [Ditylenchus destructor]|nr:hypothetical protein Ddc_16288 [Ditylenchus destructor]